MSTLTLQANTGFADPVRDAQTVFRAVMQALAEPGSIQVLPERLIEAIGAPAPLTAATSAILLALADFETAVYLDPTAATAEALAYLRFHAGCPLTDDPADARFAVIADSATLDGLDGFAIGSLEYPDRSTTLIVQVANLDDGPALDLAGPGIETTRRIRLSPLGDSLPEAFARNRALFPCGVDCLFTDGRAVLGLPRSTHVTPARGED